MNEAASLSPEPELADPRINQRQSLWGIFVKRHLLALTILVLAVCLFRWPLVSGLYSFLDIGPDLANMTIPDLEFRAQELRHGSIPIWSNYHHGGQAFLGELLSNLFNPLSYALLVMPLKDGHIRTRFFLDYFVFLQCLAAISAYFLVRDLGGVRWAAVLAGLFYAIAGPPGNSVWIEFVTEVVYLPLVLLFLFRSLRGRRPLANSAIAGAIAGVCWYSGTHHFGLIISIAGFATLLAFSIRRAWKPGLLRAAIFAVVLAFVAAPQLLPSIEFSNLSVRWVGLPDDPHPGAGKVPYQAHLAQYFHPSHLLDIPFALDMSYWGAGMAFAGIVALSFVPFAVRSLASTRLLRLLAAFALAGILLSMSAWNNLYGIAYLLVPAFDKLREGLVWIVLTHLAWTCLLGIGLTRFFAGSDIELHRYVRRVCFYAAPALLAAAYLFALLGKPEQRDMSDRLGIVGLVTLLVGGVIMLADRGIAKPALCACLLGGILMIEQGNVTGQSGLRFAPRTDEWAKRFTGPAAANDELARFLKTRSDLERVDVNLNDVPENFGEAHGIEEMSGHGAAMLSSVFSLPYWHPKARQLYGVNYYLAKLPADSSQQPVYTAASGIKVFTNPRAMPRVWTVHRIIPVNSDSEARALLDNPSFDVAEATYLDRRQVPSLEQCSTSGDRTRLRERTNWKISIDATLQCRGMVILNDNFYPGWRAYVDGQSSPILPAYMSVRGVVVNAGAHTIEMRYVPWSFYIGALLCLFGAAGIVILWRGNEQPGEDLLA